MEVIYLIKRWLNHLGIKLNVSRNTKENLLETARLGSVTAKNYGYNLLVSARTCSISKLENGKKK